MSSHGLLHAPRRIAVLPGFGSQPAPERDLRQLPGGQDEQAGDEDGFRDLPILVCGGLKGLAWRLGETIQVETVIPISAPDEREFVRPEPIEGVPETPLHVFEEGCFAPGPVVVLNGRIQNCPVPRLFEICGDPDDQPEGIVIKIAADIIVPPFRQRLVLVVCAAALELRGREIENALPGTLRDHVHEPQEILRRIPESEPPADSRFIE